MSVKTLRQFDSRFPDAVVLPSGMRVQQDLHSKVGISLIFVYPFLDPSPLL